MSMIISLYNLNIWICMKEECRTRENVDYLISLRFAQILNYAREYIDRKYILMAMGNNDQNNAQAKALLRSSTPLADVYNKYASWEHGRQQEEIWNAVEARSGEVLRAAFAAAQRSER